MVWSLTQLARSGRAGWLGGSRAFRLSWACVLVLPLSACRPNTPQSSPTALRSTNDYLQATAPAPPSPFNPHALDQVAVTREGETLVVTASSVPGANESDDGFAHPVKRLGPGQKLETPAAELELVDFTLSGPGLSRPGNEADAPLEFFAQDGSRLTTEQLHALGFKPWELRDSNSGSSSGIDDAFPKLRVDLGSRRRPPGYYSVVGLFDARTRKSVVSGYAYSQIGSDYYGQVTLRPHLWHATPLDLVLDVELDGKSVVQSNLVSNTRLSVPGGQVLWLGVWEGGGSSWSTQGGNPTVVRVNLHQAEGQTNAVALFMTEPPHLAVHIELLDARGRPLEGSGGSSGGAIRFESVRATAADIRQARLTVYTNHYRVVLSLPPLPNLPAANQHPANLFAVAIPQAQVRDESALRDLIGDTTELHFAYPPGGDVMPASLFPLVLTNTTPAQLLEAYRHYLTNGVRLVVDQSKQEIRVEPTPWRRFKNWLISLLP